MRVLATLAAQLSFDRDRYSCYDGREGQSALGSLGASRRMALSLAQPPVQVEFDCSNLTIVMLRFRV